MVGVVAAVAIAAAKAAAIAVAIAVATAVATAVVVVAVGVYRSRSIAEASSWSRCAKLYQRMWEVRASSSKPPTPASKRHTPEPSSSLSRVAAYSLQFKGLAEGRCTASVWMSAWQELRYEFVGLLLPGNNIGSNASKQGPAQERNDIKSECVKKSECCNESQTCRPLHFRKRPV